MPPPLHLNWLVDTGTTLTTHDGKIVKILEFQHTNDTTVLSGWAAHFRNYYCADSQIDRLRRGSPYTREEFLNQIKFPDRSRAPGPSLRAGDFAEILVADYVEYILDYWVPKTRYDRKTIGNESTKGSDLLGFKIVDNTESLSDELLIFEVKAQFTGTRANPRLQDAVDDSGKDQLRKAESLNAIKQRFLDQEDIDSLEKVERFQNKSDKPYTEISGAVALFSTNVYDTVAISNTNTLAHPNRTDLNLIVIHANEFMRLVHSLYDRAANEA